MAKGGTSGPTTDQLKIAQQMLTLITSMAAQSQKLSAGFESQAEATAKMADNMKEMENNEVVSQLMQVNETLKQVAASLANLDKTSAATFEVLSTGALEAIASTQQLGEAVSKTGTAAEKTKSSFDKLKDRLASTEKGSRSLKSKLGEIGEYLGDEFPVAVAAGAGALSGLKQSFSNFTAIGSSVIGFLGSLISSMWEIGKSILAIPFKMFEGLMEKANSGGGGVSELAEAFNGLRKEFGSLAGPTNSAIIAVSKSMGQLQLSGLSATKAFGNLADRMNLARELFSTGGAAIANFTDEIVKGNGAILAYQKGLGLSGEEMGGMASLALRSGKSLTSVLNNITKHSMAMGKAFGYDAKVISREMGKARMDMANFGHMSEKQLGVAVIYAKKLGIELSSIAGGLDKFADFEDAAESVSTLNATLGTNIDLNEVMQAGTQQEVAETLRKELMKAGISADKLDFRQRKLIKTQTGWDDAAIDSLLSTKNMGIALNDIQKEGDKVEKTVLTEAKALGKLSDAMDRVFKSGGGDKPKQLGEALTKGFTDGIGKSKEMLDLLNSLKAITADLYQGGVRLGKAFVNAFPGVKDILTGLTELFNPQKVGKLIDDVVTEITGFFKDLEDGKASFPDLMERLKKKFFDFFDSAAPGGRKALSGFGKFFTALKVIFAQGIEWIMKSIGGFIKDIVESLKGNGPTGVGAAVDGAASFLSPIADGFRNGWSVLGPAIGDLFNVLFDKLIDLILPKVTSFMSEHGGKIALIFFGPVFAKAMIGAGTAAIGQAIVKAFTKAPDLPEVMKGLSASVDKLSAATSGVSAKAASSGGDALGGAGAAIGSTPPAPAIANAQSVGAMITPGLIIKLLLAFAAIIAIGLVAFYIAAQIAEGMSTETILKAGAILIVVAVTAVLIGGAMFLLSKIPESDKTIIGKMIAIGVAMAALAVLGALIAFVGSKFTMSDIIKGSILILTAAITAGIVALAMVALGVVGSSAAAAIPPMLIGLAAILLGVVGLVALGALMIFAASKISAPELGPVVTIMFLIAQAVAAIALTLGMLALVGLVAFNPVGAAALYFGFQLVSESIEMMGPFAAKIVAGAGDIRPQPLKDASTKIDVVAVAIKALAEIISKILSVGFTLFGGTRLEYGFKLVGQTLENISTVALKVVAEAGKLPNNIEPKVKAFAIVMDALSNIVSVINNADLAKEIDDDEFEKLPAVINAMKDNLLAVLPAISLMVDNLIKSLANVRVSSGVAKTAEVMGPLLASIGTMIAGMTSAASEVFKNIDKDDFEKTPEIIKSLGIFVDALVVPIQTLVSAVADMVKNLPVISKEQVSSISALSTFMGALGEMSKGLSISPETKAVLEVVAKESPRRVASTLKAFGEYSATIGKVLTGPDGIIATMGTAISGIIQSMSGMKFSPSDVAMVSAIGGIIGSIIGVVSGMIGTISAVIGKSGKVDPGVIWSIQTILGSISKPVSDLLASMKDHIPGLIKGLQDSIILFAGFSPEQAEVAVKLLGAIGGIIGSVAQVAQSMIPKAEAKIDPAIIESSSQDAVKVIEKMPTIGEVLDIMKDKMPPLIESIAATIAGLSQFGDVKVFGARVEQLVKIIEAISKITEISKTLMEISKNEDPGAVPTSASDKMLAGITQVEQFMAKLLIADGPLSKMIKTMTDAQPVILGLVVFAASSAALKAGFDALKSFMDVMKSVGEGFKTSGEGDDLTGENTPLIKRIEGLAGFMESLSPHLTAMAKSLGGINTSLSTMKMPDKKTIESKLGGISTFVDAILGSSITTAAEGKIESLTNLQNLVINGITPAVQAVDDMMKSAAKIENSLNQGLKIDLDAKLKTFAGKFGKPGLGAQGAYTVSARDVIIHVKFNVSMDAKSIESTIISSSASIIKNRLNLLMDAVQDAPSADSAKTSLATGKLPSSTVLAGG